MRIERLFTKYHISINEYIQSVGFLFFTKMLTLNDLQVISCNTLRPIVTSLIAPSEWAVNHFIVGFAYQWIQAFNGSLILYKRYLKELENSRSKYTSALSITTPEGFTFTLILVFGNRMPQSTFSQRSQKWSKHKYYSYSVLEW